MKRIARRTIGVCVGIALGWYVAGLAPSFIPGLRVSMAEETSHHDAATQPSGNTPVARTPAEEAEQKEAEESPESGRRAAAELVPSQPEQQVPWFWPVVWAAAGLFIAAVVIGVPSLKIRGPLPPDPADTAHDDHAAHDDHSHGDHGKSSH